MKSHNAILLYITKIKKKRYPDIPMVGTSTSLTIPPMTAGDAAYAINCALIRLRCSIDCEPLKLLFQLTAAFYVAFVDNQSPSYLSGHVFAAECSRVDASTALRRCAAVTGVCSR